MIPFTSKPQSGKLRASTGTNAKQNQRERRALMDAATQEIVQGVTLEAISAPDLPDTESLLGEAGTMYLVAEAASEEELDPRDQVDAGIIASLLWP
jgi:hypothetical protein